MTTAIFEIGKTYFAIFVTDSSLRPQFQIITRTEKTVTVNVYGKAKNLKVFRMDECEVFYPFGKYSMAPACKSKNRA